eukprot:TRINITY_DN16902_c0_g1_i2.p1 TRINITY_DN16902_c0_g1~~TRINITY_DN16902_c0_g1_i2.p1  ORF type:complete len:122 (-),score=36.13 TRINITY_DN16902_c0_g1_i2:74-439(-)
MVPQPATKEAGVLAEEAREPDKGKKSVVEEVVAAPEPVLLRLAEARAAEIFSEKEDSWLAEEEDLDDWVLLDSGSPKRVPNFSISTPPGSPATQPPSRSAFELPAMLPTRWQGVAESCTLA